MSNTSTRRTFLTHSGNAALAAAVATTLPGCASATKGGSAKPGKMLILGGTRFLGPVIVRAALDAGWDVTLFNRGTSNPELFKDLDRRVGDRNTSDYGSLAEDEWDLVVDTSCYIPAHVTAAIDALGSRAGHYLIVSTISVYADGDGSGAAGEVLESDPLETIPAAKLSDYKVIQDVGGKDGGRYYGALKALCEKAAEEAMPGRVTVVRPGLIVGPEDGSDRYNYWPVRIARGGTVLAPGDPNVEVQYVDVRDLGQFTFEVGAKRAGTIMNGVGFKERVTMKDMLESCLVKGVDTSFKWATDKALLGAGVQPWMGLPLWIADGGRRYTNDAAIERGLTFRTLEDTAAAARQWHAEERGESYEWRQGLITPDKEREVLNSLG